MSSERGDRRATSSAPPTDGPDPSGSAASRSSESLETRLEVLLLCGDRPLHEARLAGLLETADGRPTRDEIAAAVESLNATYDATGRPFRIEAVAGGLRVLTLPRFASLVEALKGERQQARLSQAALETLAIVAYRQPMLRAELEAIRGVACGEVLRGLMDRRLVRITGRAEIIGRPMLYGTTREFLQVFGLAGLDDLPRATELRPPPPRRSRPKVESDRGDEDRPTATSVEVEPPPPAAESS